MAAAVAALPVAAFAQGTITVNPSAVGAAVSPLVRGVNMANWFDVTQTGVASALKSAGMMAVRWPGGSESDEFHWQSNAACFGAYVNPTDTFDTFIQTLAVPDKLRVAITLNYGTNATCNGPGDPTEAVAWVNHAAATGAPVDYWTVGNEVYGGWETDLHTPAHDATTYAQAVANGYYKLIKAAQPKANVGVVVNPGNQPAWDPIVLAQAKYDFVEYHYYAQNPGGESDSYLLQSAPQALTASINQIKSELATAGHPTTPIFVGELGSVSYNPGKQTMSITQALYAGMVQAELMQDGVARATWWLGFGGCNDASGGGNFASSLYGLQNFGGYMVFSDGLPEYGCYGAPSIPLGVKLPTAQTLAMISKVAVAGSHMLGVTLSGTPSTLRAYAMTHGTGYALLLFNLDENNAVPVSIAVSGIASGTSASTLTYDKTIYDKSRSGVWAGPAAKSLGAWSGAVSVTLPVWSMTLVSITN
jgi:hypothetical protein